MRKSLMLLVALMVLTFGAQVIHADGSDPMPICRKNIKVCLP